MVTTSYAIWVSRNSKDNGFTVWASPAPNYSIPQTLEEGITKVKEFVAKDDFLPGTGTWLCGFESEREMILGQMSAEGVISWNNPEWEKRVIVEQDFIPDADRNNYILEGMTEEDIWGDSLTTIPISTDSHQFENRYSIYCHDPFEYEPVSNELVVQLAKNLGAINPVIVTTEMSSGRVGKYLTADSFDILQDKINDKESNQDYLAEGYGAYLLDISDTHFYHGYPKLFWKNYKFDDRLSSEDEWGEVCYTNPIPFERSLR